MNVILSEAKDLRVGMRVDCKQLRIDEAKIIQGNLKSCSPMRGPSLRSG
jgi:hypothetical protein